MSAIGLDANNGLWPLAYSFAKCEDHENWRWFMQHLKEVIGDHQVVVMSDRHGSLITAIREYFGEHCHSFCYRHLKDSFGKE